MHCGQRAAGPQFRRLQHRPGGWRTELSGRRTGQILKFAPADLLENVNKRLHRQTSLLSLRPNDLSTLY